MRSLRNKARPFGTIGETIKRWPSASLDWRLRVNSVQVDTDTGRFVVLEQVTGDRVQVTELGESFTLGMPLPRAEWLSSRYRTPTPRELDAYRKGLALLP